MLTPQERARQFAPFDAMKGLQEALRDREEKHSRVEKHDISDEAIEHNSMVISKLKKNSKVEIEYYCAFHDVVRQGYITELSIVFKWLKLNGEKIVFDDIYRIEMIG